MSGRVGVPGRSQLGWGKNPDFTSAAAPPSRDAHLEPPTGTQAEIVHRHESGRYFRMSGLWCRDSGLSPGL